MLIILFMIGYLAVGALRFNEVGTMADLVVAVILVAGGFFVLIVTHLSAATTIDVIRIAKLEIEVARDPLTGMFNRRNLDQRFEAEFDQARRFNRPLSAALIDIDHFKKVNDTHGHPAGDLVLKHISGVISRHSRGADTVVRYGGEEFLVIAPDSDLDAASALGERIIGIIASSPIALPDDVILSVTASIGVACLADDEDLESLLARADKALYTAKREGRNRLCASAWPSAAAA